MSLASYGSRACRSTKGGAPRDFEYVTAALSPFHIISGTLAGEKLGFPDITPPAYTQAAKYF